MCGCGVPGCSGTATTEVQDVLDTPLTVVHVSGQVPAQRAAGGQS